MKRALPLINYTVIFLWLLFTGCSSHQYSESELTDRFLNPKKYEEIDPSDAFARDNAVVSMQKEGLLVRGIHKERIKQLLGEPDINNARESGDWRYYLNSSELRISFDNEGRVTKYVWYYEEGGPPDWTW